jgi:SAM-dependent methyltransferase
MPERREHWEEVYRTRSAEGVSWYQPRPDISLELARKYVPDMDAAILDVGGGASTFADHLLAIGYTDLSVLDISQAALEQVEKRLGARAGVRFIVADITAWTPDRRYDFWHDRAVLHFLIEAKDQAAYAGTLRKALKPGAIAVIAGFAPGGPEKCSGLPIVQHDRASLAALLGAEFTLLDTRDESHRTPWNTEQSFRYHVFRRAGES